MGGRGGGNGGMRGPWDEGSGELEPVEVSRQLACVVEVARVLVCVAEGEKGPVGWID